MPRIARAAALFVRHTRPSWSKRSKAGQRLSMQSMALATSAWFERRARAARPRPRRRGNAETPPGRAVPVYISPQPIAHQTPQIPRFPATHIEAGALKWPRRGGPRSWSAPPCGRSEFVARRWSVSARSGADGLASYDEIQTCTVILTPIERFFRWCYGPPPLAINARSATTRRTFPTRNDQPFHPCTR